MLTFNSDFLRNFATALNEIYDKEVKTGISYSDWLSTWNKISYESGREFIRDKKGFVDLQKYPKLITMSPEPIDILDLFITAEGQEEVREIFNREVPPKCRSFEIKETPKYDEVFVWYNSTAHGVNIRPGFINGNKQLVEPFTLSDNPVHCKGGGETGSGKSVAINTIILNWLVEYAPWELELWLADFKKVELSPYANVANTPHVKTVAATGELDYVVSLLEIMRNRMEAREKFFALYGVKNIKEYREVTGLSLPRVIFLVDEFQELFLKATGKQEIKINSNLTSIVKKGRSSGFHLFLTSQSLKGTVSQDLLDNIGASFALRSTPALSESLIGNPEAATLKGVGGFIANLDSEKRKEDNVRYKVPFAPTPVIHDMLRGMDDLAMKLGYENNMKFFDEDKMSTEKILVGQIRDRYKTGVEVDEELEEVFVLGDTCIFKETEQDWEILELRKDKRQNITVVCDKAKDMAYFMRLLAKNIEKSEKASKNYLVVANKAPMAYYNLEEDLEIEEFDSKKEYPLQDLEGIFTYSQFLEQMYMEFGDDGEIDLSKVYRFLANLGMLNKSESLNKCLMEKGEPGGLNDKDSVIYDALLTEMEYYEDAVARYGGRNIIELRPATYVWIVGAEKLEGNYKSIERISNLVKDGPTYRVFHIWVSGSIRGKHFYLLLEITPNIF